MMTSTDWVRRLKHLAFKRVTYYDNTFPGNCGEINADGSISFDCIGMIKSVINEPDIVYKTAATGYYVKPGQVIPDTDELGILNLCTGIKWHSFIKMVAGEYLYMSGHGGVYVGDFSVNGLIFNVIECTAAWQGGVVASYIDSYGRRFDHKGGTQCLAWEAHGELSKYIKRTQIKVDGVWGKETTLLAQKVYGVTKQPGLVLHQNKSYKAVCPACSGDTWRFDGSKGYSYLIAAIQKACGMNLPKTHRKYGKMSRTTRIRFQQKLGVKADGIIGPATVKAFQKFLNRKA